MRTITSHHTNEANRAIEITADEQNQANGNASHYYLLKYPAEGLAGATQFVSFQNGPIKENGVNGVTNEALLAIVIDRLQGFQSSQYACRENAIALTKLQEAAMWLESRTKAREARGVEGTHKV